MAKNTFLSFSTTAGDNTDVGGIVILGSAAVSNFDNAFRTLMAILRGDLDNGTVFVTKSAGYTAVAGDNNAFYEFTATATLALTAAATLAADWHMMVFANGGVVTVDPDASELVNGATTLTIADGNAAYIICTGTAFKAIQIKPRMFAKGADVASATALALGNDGNYFDITGTTAITSIVTKGVGTVVKLHFDGILTLTHHATDLVLPGGANITTSAGDEAEFIEYAAGDWRCTNYTPAASRAPTRQVFLSGSGTYTTPANCTAIKIRMIGGGGGGAGSGTSPGAVGSSSVTTFASLTASLGGAASGAAGGTTSGPAGGDVNLAGADGGNGSGTTNSAGGMGGNSPFGGGGPGGAAGGGAGKAAKTNTGAGGGGAGCSGTVNSGGGGAAGGYIEATITNPAATYSYSVGAGGTGGTAGTSGAAGGAGGSGIIIVDEFYG